MLIFNACSSAPRFTTADDEDENTTEKLKEENIDISNFTPLETEYGEASYYADKFHGRKTANGEIYNMYGISAAHISYPLGTIIKVTNLSNNLSVILKINDRMPDIHNRLIDLSLGAAKKLDMLKSGTARVKIEVIKWGKGKK